MNIRLIEPADGTTTEPLQKFAWPDGDDASALPEYEPIVWDDLKVVSGDRSHAQPVFFSWELEAADDVDVLFDLVVSEHEDLRHARVLKGLRQPRTEVFHLHVGTTYYYAVETRVDGEIVSTSPTRSFVTHAATPRWITVPGITNVRDVGGWPLPGGGVVTQGCIYRGSEMDPHLAISDEGRRVLEDELCIKTDLDLRGTDETTGAVLDEERVRWINIPVLPYEHIAVDEQKEQYRQVFSALADSANYPLFFHCWGGADRVGTVSFMLGALLGKDFAHLARDYELTTFSVWGVRSRHSEQFQALLAALQAHAPGQDVHQQVEAYLLDAGVTPEQITQLRSNLTA